MLQLCHTAVAGAQYLVLYIKADHLSSAHYGQSPSHIPAGLEAELLYCICIVFVCVLLLCCISMMYTIKIQVQITLFIHNLCPFHSYTL